MSWVMWSVGVLVLVGVLVALVGARLPVAHSVTRTINLALAPDALYARLSDVDRYQEWRTDLKRLERLPDRQGMPAWIEHTSSGRLPLAFEHMDRPSQLVARITDPSLPFGGTWTYRIAPGQAGSQLSITEDGAVYNVIFRFLSRFVFGHTATIDRFITQLQASIEQGVAR